MGIKHPWKPADDETRALFPELTNEAQLAFLQAYLVCGEIEASAKAANVSGTSTKRWRFTDNVFAACFKRAHALVADILEDTLHVRAVKGVQRPIFWNGEQVGEETVYSDKLLLEGLKARRRELYGTQVKQEVTLSEPMRQLMESWEPVANTPEALDTAQVRPPWESDVEDDVDEEDDDDDEEIGPDDAL